MSWSRELLVLLGQDADLSRLAAEYLNALQWSLLPALGIVVIRSFLAAHERPRLIMVASWLVVGVHVLTNWLLMFGHWGFPAMGLVGAGISSTLSHTVLFVGLAVCVLRDRTFRRYQLLAGWWRMDWRRLRDLLRLGVPMGLAMAFEISGFNIAAFMIGTISAAALAAHAVVLQASTATFMVPLAIGQAATVRVGLAYGAGDGSGVRRAGWCAFALGIGFMVTTGLGFALFPDPIAHLFLDPAVADNQPPLQMIGQLFVIVAMFQIFDGTQVVGAGVLRGVKDTVMPMVFAGVGYWLIAIPVGAWLAFRLEYGAAGVWIGLAIGLLVVAVLIMTRWMRLRTIKV